MLEKRVKTNIIGKNVIGIDELNNGYHLNSLWGKDCPMIICGYLIRNYSRSSCSNGKFEAKGRLFGKHGHDLQEILRRTRYYSEHFPNFFYLTLQKKEVKTFPVNYRAQAISSITLRFFQEPNISDKNTILVLDKMDNKDFSEKVAFLCREYFDMAGLDIQIKIQEHADKYNTSVKKADRVARYIGALRFKGNSKKWPYPKKRVFLQDLNTFIIAKRHPEIFQETGCD